MEEHQDRHEIVDSVVEGRSQTEVAEGGCREGKSRAEAAYEVEDAREGNVAVEVGGALV